MRLLLKQKRIFVIGMIALFLNSCYGQDNNTFSYTQFKEALYYNPSAGEFSDLGNLEMCINRWGMPKYVKSMGTMNFDGSNSKLSAIVFNWSNILVDGKNVEIVFQAIPESGKTIEDVFTNSINPSKAKYLKVKEFRLVPVPKS